MSKVKLSDANLVWVEKLMPYPIPCQGLNNTNMCLIGSNVNLSTHNFTCGVASWAALSLISFLQE